MYTFKNVFLWVLLVLTFTPLAFILMPIITIAAILGAIDTMRENPWHAKTEFNS